MKRMIETIDKILSNFLVVLMVGMVLDVFWQVFTRFVTRHPSSFTEELATFFMIWIGLLGGAYALRQKAHLGIDILTQKMSPDKKLKWEFFIYSNVILFSLLVMIWGGIRLVYVTFYLKQVSAALKVPMGGIYLVVPITGILFIFYSIYFMTEAYKKLKLRSFEESQKLIARFD